jgi:hypothetical protein
MKPTLQGLLLALTVLGLVSCQREKPVPAGSYRLAVENLADYPDSLRVTQLVITACDRYTVRVTTTGKTAEAVAEPDRDSQGIVQARILILGDLALAQGGTCQLTSLLQIRTAGVRAGGPSRRSVDSERKLSDLMKLDVRDGDYPLGQDLKLGELQGEPIVLEVR